MANVVTLTSRDAVEFFRGMAARVEIFAARNGGRVIIFDDRTLGALWLGSRSCDPGRFSVSREKASAVRARLWVIFTPPSAVGQDIASTAPFRHMSKIGADPPLVGYDYTGGRYFVNQRLKFVSVGAAVWSYRTLLFRRGNTFERRLSSQVC